MISTLRTLALIALVLTTQASLAQFLIDDKGERLLDDKGGFLLTQETSPSGGAVHSVMQIATWEGGARVISLFADVMPDRAGVKLLAHASEGDKAVKFVWLYLNSVVVATCPGNSCDFVQPTSLMRAGVNEILVAYQPETGPALGTSFKISRP
jgi:hypothetical protein